jgi:hypothetical protein
MYALIQGTQSGVSLPHQASHLASLPSGMVDVSHPPIGKGNVMEALRVSPCGVRHSRGLTGSLHCPNSLKRLINSGLSVALVSRLLAESFFSHIQISISEMLRVPSDSPRIGRGTSSGLCCPPRSAACGASADPKPVRFGVVDASLCLDMLERYVQLPCASSRRCQLGELVELFEMYVL